MPDVVIADAGCFIILSNISELDLLQKVYIKIITTPDIAHECGESLPEWVIIKSPSDFQKQQILELQIDKGKCNCFSVRVTRKLNYFRRPASKIIGCSFRYHHNRDYRCFS